MKKFKLCKENVISGKINGRKLKEFMKEHQNKIIVCTGCVIIALTSIFIAKTIIPPETTAIVQQQQTEVTVIVEQGNTLSELAEEYYTTIEEISKLNHIENPDEIQVGQILRIQPGEKYFEQSNSSICEKWDEKISDKGYVKGIDVSKHQYRGGLNLKKVIKQNDIDFVIIRSNYFWSDRNYDEGFDKFAQAAHDSNVAIGIYFWPTLKDIQSTKEELDVVCAKLDEVKSKGIYCTMPIFLDIELEQDGGGDLTDRIKSGDKETEKCFKFAIDYLRDKGYDVRVYANKNVCKNYGVEELAKKYDVKIWLSRYLVGNPLTDQSAEPTERYMGIPCDIIQYSQNGAVKGYKSPLDLDVCYENIPKDIIKNGLNGTNEMDESQKIKVYS